MDEQLAAIYGTDQVEETDLEKTAAAELLVKLAEENGVDLNDFSDEEVGEMLNDLYANGIEHTAEAAPEAAAEEATEEMQEKFAEADYLGRIMAHSMVQELDSIEKEAGKFSEGAGKAWGAVSGAVKGTPKRVSKGARQLREAITGNSPGNRAKYHPDYRKRVGKAGLKALAPELAAGGVLAAGGTALAMEGKKKEGSAIETLAQQRAFDMAKEAGYVDEEGTFIEQEQEKTALDLAVERRALEICESEGIPVEWNE